MKLPELNLINPVDVGGAEISQAAMQAPARAAAATSQTISNIAKTGENLIIQIGRSRDAGEESKGRMMLRDFQGNMTRMVIENPNQEEWMPEYEKQLAKLQSGIDQLNLSPNGRNQFNSYVQNWQSQQQNALLDSAARASVERDKQQVTNEVKMAIDANDRVAGVQAIQSGIGRVFTPEQGEAMLHEFEKDIDVRELYLAAENDPLSTIDALEAGDFHERNPRVSPEKRRALLNYAKGQKEDARREELDLMEVAFMDGNLTNQDIEAATFLTDRDRRVWARSLRESKPPTNEAIAEAWTITDTLRDARNDPAITQEQYREMHNEARTTVAGIISPNFSGDILKELNYLSPAGRHASGGTGPFDPDAGFYSKNDLAAAGRDAIRRARDAGVFGDLSDYSKLSKQDKEDAYRRANAIEIQVKSFVQNYKGDDLTPEKVWEYADNLMVSPTIKSAPQVIPKSAPGTGGGFMPKPMILPEKGSIKELNDFINNDN